MVNTKHDPLMPILIRIVKSVISSQLNWPSQIGEIVVNKSKNFENWSIVMYVFDIFVGTSDYG